MFQHPNVFVNKEKRVDFIGFFQCRFLSGFYHKCLDKFLSEKEARFYSHLFQQFPIHSFHIFIP